MKKYPVRQFSPLQLFPPPLYQYHMNPLTDTELFSQIAEGDEKVSETLFNRYLPFMQPVILQIVKSEAAATDIVQDLFLKL